MLIIKLSNNAGKINRTSFSPDSAGHLLITCSGFFVSPFSQFKFDNVFGNFRFGHVVVIEQIGQILFGHFLDSETLEKIDKMCRPNLGVKINPGN